MILFKIFFLAASACAQPTAFNWEEVRDLALKQNAGLQSAEKSWQSSRAGEKGAYGGFLPTVSLNARRQRTETESYAIEAATRNRVYSVAASWNLFNGFATFANVRRASAQAEESLAARDLTSADVRYQLRRAFFSLYIQQARIDLSERILKRQEQNEKLISLKHNAGTEALWNVMRAQAERERSVQRLAVAKSDLAQARDNLAALLNVDALPEGNAQISSPEAIMNPTATTDISQHPSLARSRFAAEKLGQDITLARAAFLPSIDLSYSRTRDLNEIGARNRSDGNSFAIVAQWQIFNGLSDFHKVQQARLAFEAAELEREKNNRDLLSSVRSADRGLEVARTGLPVAKALRVAAEERVRTVSAQYRSGLKNYIEWEQAESQLLEYEQGELSSLQDGFNALAEYERAHGIKLEQP